jgi:hypothetical protein
MAGQITKEFDGFFNTRGYRLVWYALKQAQKFIGHTYKCKKLGELCSYFLWELAHRLKLNPQGRYIHFVNKEAELKFEDAQLVAIKRQSRDLTATSWQLFPQPWALAYVVMPQIWGVIAPAGEILVLSDDGGLSARPCHTFPAPLQSIYVSRHHDIFVCCQGKIYKSADAGATFRVVLELSHPASYVRHDYGITEDEQGRIFIGEYSNVWSEADGWKNTAWLYWSLNNGDNFSKTDFLQRAGANKHVHLIKFCSNIKKLFLTDGDNKKRLWVNDTLENFDRPAASGTPGWRLVNHCHIATGGYFSALSVPHGIMFGSDYLGGTNFLVHSHDGHHFQKRILPDPFRRNPVANMSLLQSADQTEIWVGIQNHLKGKYAKALLLYSRDRGLTWHKSLEYDGLECDIQIISASSQPLDFFLAAILDSKKNVVATLQCRLRYYRDDTFVPSATVNSGRIE